MEGGLHANPIPPTRMMGALVVCGRHLPSLLLLPFLLSPLLLSPPLLLLFLLRLLLSFFLFLSFPLGKL